MELPILKMSTQKQWADLVLSPACLQQLIDLRTQLQKNSATGVTKKRLKPGYRALFYGPSGTGKSLAASLLANDLSREAYRIDLATIYSNYIGETEKNLELLFERAEKNNWVLFFDEADSLFGKRTDIKDANDRYANLETNYLVQRIEDYPGLLILASNMKSNIDDAFMRRFQMIIEFPFPGIDERRKLWELALSGYQPVVATIDIDLLAEKYTLSPAAIVNVVEAAKQNSSTISFDHIDQGIQFEMSKQA